MTKRSLWNLLKHNRPVLLGGAHDALSSRLIQDAGFDGIWASGYGISASHSLPDAGIMTMSEYLETSRFMAHAVEIPIIADCDNGYGNAINAMRTAREYDAAGIAGMSVEDNVFPKRCSFYEDVFRELEEPRAFCKKIKAIANARVDDDFFLIARSEALIAGLGMEEALRRGEAYAEAGADAVLIHSKSRDGKEAIEVARRWKMKVPLVSVPSTYPNLSSAFLYKCGFKIIIFANQGIRASVKAQRETYSRIIRRGRADSVSKNIETIDSVNAIVGIEKLRKDEKDYL